jgi:hypothetical protein
MPLATSHPPMSHSPAYCNNRINISPALHAGHGPASSHVQPPPAAHLYQQPRSLLPVATSPLSRPSSESGRLPKRAHASETRPSAVGQTSPQSTSPLSFSLSSSAEQGSISHGLDRGTKRDSGRYDTLSGQRSPRPDRNMMECHTTVYTYTPEAGGVEMSTDHAVPVLVRANMHLRGMPLVIDVPYSSGLHALIRSTRFSVPCTPSSPHWLY